MLLKINKMFLGKLRISKIKIKDYNFFLHQISLKYVDFILFIQLKFEKFFFVFFFVLLINT